MARVQSLHWACVASGSVISALDESTGGPTPDLPGQRGENAAVGRREPNTKQEMSAESISAPVKPLASPAVGALWERSEGTRARSPTGVTWVQKLTLPGDTPFALRSTHRPNKQKML